MRKPKEVKASEKLGWHMNIREIPNQSGFSYPVFEWSYGYKDGFWGGELRAWPLEGELIFKDRREDDDCKFQSVEDALVKIKQYEWGKPPYIDAIFKDILTTKEKFPVKSLREAKKIFDELRQKWQALLIP